MFLVRPSDAFVEAATISAVEAFALGDGRGDGFKETIATVWGTRRYSKDEGANCVIHLERCHTALSAERTAASAYQSPESRHLAENAMFVFQPTMMLLGDLHTHPYKNRKQTTDNKGWEFSRGDFRAFMRDDDLWRDEASTPVMAVMAICEIGKVHETELKVDGSVMEFNIGEFRLWLNVCVGWIDEGGERRNTAQDEDEDHYCALWVNPYFNYRGARLKGTTLIR